MPASSGEEDIRTCIVLFWAVATIFPMRRVPISFERSFFQNAARFFTKFFSLPFEGPLEISTTQVELYLYEFIEGFGGVWDWDAFISTPIIDPQLESIRLKASQINLPVNEEGLKKLSLLLSEVKGFIQEERPLDPSSLKVQYIHLSPNSSPPEALISHKPFSVVVIVQADVTSEWRHEVSEWLVKEGCLCMMAGDPIALYGMTVLT